MMGFTRVSLGVAAASACLVSMLLISNCSDAPLTPSSNSSVRSGTPLMTLNPVFDNYTFLGFVTDVGGANDVPAQSDLNAFTRADNYSGHIGVKWVWDDVNSWTGTGQTGDACALFDTDNDAKGNANYAVCVRITNPNGDPTTVAQLASPASPLLYSCGNSKTERCASPVRPLSVGGIICEVEKVNGETYIAAGEDGADVLASCSIPLSTISATATPNLTNVCSFPSGSPNSNPFDCVVTPGAGFLIIKKATTPDNSGLTFPFTVSPVTASGASFNIVDNSAGLNATALLSATPGNNAYSVTEGSLPTGWALNSASCVLDRTPPVATGTPSGVAVNSFTIASGETTICTFDNRVTAPTISVVKTAGQATVPETGGNVTYTVQVTNNSTITVTLDSLIDDVFGDLGGQGSCNGGGNPYGTIAPSGTYTCTFTKALGAANANGIHVNQVTAHVSSDGGPVSANDTAKVTYSDVLPDITVSKSVDQSQITATGGALSFTPDRTFNRAGGGGGGSTTPIFDNSTCDDAPLPNDAPAQSDLNCFSRADNVSGRLWLRWTWDDINSWTGAGQTGDACALIDTNNNGSANYALCVRINNPGGDPNVVAQLNPGSPILYNCKDKEGDRCATQFSIESATGTTCTVTTVPDGISGGEDGADAQAECDLNLANVGVSIANIDLLNVCSFPSGSPNSNPFDCVVTPGAGFLVIAKNSGSAYDDYFGYTLRNADNSADATATDNTSKYQVQYGAQSAAIPVLPGNYSLNETMGSGWGLTGVSCSKDGGAGPSETGTATTSGINNFTIAKGQTTTCTFNNALSASSTVTFTVTVTNNSLEAVTLLSLQDSENPLAGTPTYVTLNGVGSCATGDTIAGNGGTYTCTFTRTISGSPGYVHRNKVKAVGRDNENNLDTEFSSVVTVTIN